MTVVASASMQEEEEVINSGSWSIIRHNVEADDVIDFIHNYPHGNDSLPNDFCGKFSLPRGTGHCLVCFVD